MILHVHSDALYLSKPKVCSRAGGYYFLSLHSPNPLKPAPLPPPPNGLLYTVLKIMGNMMGSVAEAEIGSTYLNGQEYVPICTTLAKMGHHQMPTPTQVDNSTAKGFANRTIKQKRSKAIDMSFDWVQDRVRQSQFLIYWQPGSTNLRQGPWTPCPRCRHPHAHLHQHYLLCSSIRGSTRTQSHLWLPHFHPPSSQSRSPSRMHHCWWQQA